MSKVLSVQTQRPDIPSKIYSMHITIFEKENKVKS